MSDGPDRTADDCFILVIIQAARAGVGAGRRVTLVLLTLARPTLTQLTLTRLALIWLAFQFALTRLMLIESGLSLPAFSQLT